MSRFDTSAEDLRPIVNELRRRLSDLERVGAATEAQRAPWVDLTAENGYTENSGASIQAYKDPFGRVYLRGGVTVPNPPPSGSVAQVRICQLPPGYRPPAGRLAWWQTLNYSRPSGWIDDQGNVVPLQALAGDTFELDLAQFRVV